MLSLTGMPLLVVSTLLALVAPVLAAWWWHQLDGRTPTVLVLRTVAVVLAQVMAVVAVFAWVNRSYSFYSSWSDLFGLTHQNAGIAVNQAKAPDGSRIAVLHLSGSAVGDAHQALVWLPKQYGEPAYAHTRFPVVMFLPGQPSTPGTTYEKFDFGQVAGQAIDSGRVAPFVAVIPPLMTNAPRDTECTNIPGGPQAETYLAQDVPTALERGFRVAPLGPQWTLAGWSTGAFCAAKLGLAHPHAFGSAISFGGYFQPVTDHTTGDLFHGSRTLQRQNSPLWLLTHDGSQGLRMLLIAGRQDKESWATTNRMLRMSTGNPDVSFIAFPTGGHNFRNYRSYLGQALQWAHPASSA